MGKRIFLIVLDSVGVGEAPDAELFDDVGCDTFGTCVRSGKLHVPNLEKLGICSLEGTSFQKKVSGVEGCYARMREDSMGKDTTVGHWEIAGLISRKPFPTYPNGFPQEIIDAFSKATGRGVLCNQPYSGTEVIKKYGREQERTGGRVIARPFVGTYPDYQRTVNRHDFSLEPPRETILDALKAAGYQVIGVGKIKDIFAGKGLTRSYPNEGNQKNMEQTLEILKEDFTGLCFVNLVDFDMLYGHRNDIDGYVNALNEVDVQLGELMAGMGPEDYLMITADHGCDPGFKGTDHSREYTPCLCWGKRLKKGVDLGTRGSFADIAQTIGELFGLSWQGDGSSFLGQILR